MDNASQKFEAMVNAHGKMILRYAYCLCRDRSLADDLVQETFLRAWRFRDGLRDESKAKAWLIATLRREYARTFERYQPKFSDLEPEQLADFRINTNRDIEPWELRRAIAALPVKLREPLVLQVVFGYNGEEIARMLGVPKNTANTRLFRARQRLRTAIVGVDERDTGSTLGEKSSF